MMKNSDIPSKGEIIIYPAAKGKSEIEVRLKEGTIWLTQKQISDLFSAERSVVTKHLRNIFASGELRQGSVCAIFAHTATDGKVYKTKHYNIDAVISVGYRVNSKKATQFRIWATKTLKDHLIKGYSINKKMLLKKTEQLKDLKDTIDFLMNKADQSLLSGQANEILRILSEYSKSIRIFEQYDKGSILKPKGNHAKYVLTYDFCENIIKTIKDELVLRKEAGDLFGHEVSHKFKAIIGSLYQTFGGKELYFSIEEKAANLLYLTIKDHPFADGNKRIASLLFIYFLENCNYLYKDNGEKKINDNALIALTLLIAVSSPSEKDIMTKIVMNMI